LFDLADRKVPTIKEVGDVTGIEADQKTCRDSEGFSLGYPRIADRVKLDSCRAAIVRRTEESNWQIASTQSQSVPSKRRRSGPAF
jgi:hypothetical protein